MEEKHHPLPPPPSVQPIAPKDAESAAPSAKAIRHQRPQVKEATTHSTNGANRGTPGKLVHNR